MPPVETLVAFFLAAAVFAYMPGPSTLYAAAQTIAKGPRAGWFAALGIHMGGYVHVLAAAFGLAILFAAVPFFYAVLKIIGAVYLIWLGVRMVMARSQTPVSEPDKAKIPPRQAFWQSVTVEVLNPKTALFYLAFLPQFTDPDAVLAIWLQLLILGTIVNLMFSSADVICVILAHKISAYFSSADASRQIANRLGGGLLVGLGLNVAFSRQ